MKNQELLTQVRSGVMQEMQSALTDDSLTRAEMHTVTQSYVLLEILDKLDDFISAMSVMDALFDKLAQAENSQA